MEINEELIFMEVKKKNQLKTKKHMKKKKKLGSKIYFLSLSVVLGFNDLYMPNAF